MSSPEYKAEDGGDCLTAVSSPWFVNSKAAAGGERGERGGESILADKCIDVSFSFLGFSRSQKCYDQSNRIELRNREQSPAEEELSVV
jgi:hypothetical protein